MVNNICLKSICLVALKETLFSNVDCGGVAVCFYLYFLVIQFLKVVFFGCNNM